MDKINEGMFDELREQLPALIAHAEIEKHLGGVISRGYLANLNCEGKGPRRIYIGRKVVYRREDLLEWLQSRVQEINTRPKKAVL